MSMKKDLNMPALVRPGRRAVLLGGASILTWAALAPSVARANQIGRALIDWLLPTPPKWPHRPTDELVAEAERLSRGIEAHVIAFLEGRGPAELPRNLVPRGIGETSAQIYVARDDDVTPEDYWIVRPAIDRIDPNGVAGLYADPHCTYIIPGAFVVPFGHKVVIEGDFPRARFFSIQVSPPFDPRFYYYNGAFGAPEVPMIDVDIDPLPGHVNPFRDGADRTARRRGFRVELEMVVGDGAAIEPAYRPPHYRSRGNRRKGAGLAYQGPLGLPGVRGGHGRGVWDGGGLWLRYYAPDRGTGPLAGVRLPKIWYELPDGRRYLLIVNPVAKDAEVNRKHRLPRTSPSEPNMDLDGPTFGWMRDLDIFHGGIAGIFRGNGKDTPRDKAQGRALVLGFAAKGANLPGSGSYSTSASRAPHIAYLSRSMALGGDKVIVLTGRMPRFPATRRGERRMTGGQVRYVSITTYPQPDLFNLSAIGTPATSVMDDEIVLDESRRYVIAYSRQRERPRNAVPEAGVTWVDWGPTSACGWVVRWLTVFPHTKDVAITPDDAKIGYAQASWLSPEWDQTLVGINGSSPIMGEYMPRVHYMDRDAFEALGPSVSATDIPKW